MTNYVELFEQYKILINTSPERSLIQKDIQQHFKLLREYISKLDIKEMKRVSYCKQVAPDPRGLPKEKMEEIHLILPDFAIKCSYNKMAPDPRGPPYKKFQMFDLLLPEFAKLFCF